MNNSIEVMVQNLSHGREEKFNRVVQSIPSLQNLVSEYRIITNDLISSKIKYIEIVKKYTEENNFKAIPSTFPGVSPTSPRYSNEIMRSDSDELIKLGEVINELEEQKNLIFSQIRQTLKSIVSLCSTLSDDIEQIDMLLSSKINNVSLNGTYGSLTYNSLSK